MPEYNAITSRDYKDQLLHLVDESTGRIINKGDICKDFRGEDYIVINGSAPWKEASQGFIWSDEFGAQDYPSVINAKWIHI